MHSFGLEIDARAASTLTEKENLVRIRGTAIADSAHRRARHPAKAAQNRARPFPVPASPRHRHLQLVPSLIEQAQSDITIGRLVRLAEFSTSSWPTC